MPMLQKFSQVLIAAVESRYYCAYYKVRNKHIVSKRSGDLEISANSLCGILNDTSVVNLLILIPYPHFIDEESEAQEVNQLTQGFSANRMELQINSL